MTFLTNLKNWWSKPPKDQEVKYLLETKLGRNARITNNISKDFRKIARIPKRQLKRVVDITETIEIINTASCEITDNLAKIKGEVTLAKTKFQKANNNLNNYLKLKENK